VIGQVYFTSAMRSAYGAKENEICQHPATIIVDAANVMGSRPDGWWRDRAGAAVRLHAEVAALAARGQPVLPDEPDPPQFVMVLEGAARPAAARIDAARTEAADGRIDAARTEAADGRIDAARTEAADGRVRVVRADGSGDDTIVALVRELPGRRFVVTADRELRRRCVAAGAAILSPGWLLGRLREP
jgi:8-oxo-dGTP diphosphatase